MTDTSSSKDQRTVEEIMDQDAPVRSKTPVSLNDVVILAVALALLTAIVFLFIR
jgi:hypothetical protein